MEETRLEKIERLWEDMHGFLVPCFYWQKHPHMEYFYNSETDEIECECGISIPLEIPTEEITEDYLVELIDNLEIKVLNEYKDKYNIDLGYKPHYD